MHSSAVIPLKKAKCPVCGVTFVRQCSAAAWGFAYDGALVCSYKCMREAERRDREREETVTTVEGTKQERARQTAEIARLYREGMEVREIAEHLGRCTNTVYHALKRSGIQLRISKLTAKKEEPAKMEPEKKIPAYTDEGTEKVISALEAQLAEEKSLADAAMELMILWKEKYELAERNRSIIEDLSRKEAAYFEALRTARTKKEKMTC